MIPKQILRFFCCLQLNVITFFSIIKSSFVHFFSFINSADLLQNFDVFSTKSILWWNFAHFFVTVENFVIILHLQINIRKGLQKCQFFILVLKTIDNLHASAKILQTFLEFSLFFITISNHFNCFIQFQFQLIIWAADFLMNSQRLE